MARELTRRVLFLLSALAAVSGCLAQKSEWSFHRHDDLAHYRTVATDIEYPTVPVSRPEDIGGDCLPHSLNDAGNVQYWDLTLQEALQLAMQHSQVIRDLGGVVLRTPDSAHTYFDPAVVETDPQFGVQAALSAFDATLAASMNTQKNNYELNDTTQGNAGWFLQDLDTFETQITKRAATGTQFTIRNTIDFNHDNNAGDQFTRGAWDEIIEGEVRHPLLQGGGLDFNRIAGPGGRPGAMNGVLLARVKTDISLADFEIGIRDLIANVENAYWDLYFAYRDLDAKIKARDSALETWRQIHALNLAGRRGGEADKEAQAREQYFRFEEDVQNALAGRLQEGTRTNNGSTPGTFRATPGVYAGERRLRLLCGLPLNEQRVIRPSEDPPAAPVIFDWCKVVGDAIARRVELRRQRWQVKHRELELLATKNFLLPNLDLVGRYGFRGFGQGLIDPGASAQFDNAFTSLTHDGYQEWQMGMEFSMPLGFREGHTAVCNAELLLARARAVLQEQEQEVIHGLSDAVADVDRGFTVLLTNVNRSAAAKDQLASVQAAYEQDKVEFFVVLDAQRRLAEAESAYYEARVEYALALRNVHFEKGTILDDYGICLAEGPWSDKAYRDAAELNRRRGRPRPLNYASENPLIVSLGQGAAPPGQPSPAPAELLPAALPQQMPMVPAPQPPAAPAPQGESAPRS
jgi:outer membrane protein TolC